MSTWIKCQDVLPLDQQDVIFRTDHEGVKCGKFELKNRGEEPGTHLGTFIGIIHDRRSVIGWHVWKGEKGSEVIEWQPLPE